MRIIAGRFKGHSLKSPPGELARPTTDRARESMFNLVVHRIQMNGARVLDLFAGSGALGIEAVSRGAGPTTFVDNNHRMLEVARENTRLMDADHNWRYVSVDVSTFLKSEPGSEFDLILADPPYDLDWLKELPDRALSLVADGGLFVLEHDRRTHFDEHSNLETSRKYGRTMVSIFRPPSHKPRSPNE